MKAIVQETYGSADVLDSGTSTDRRSPTTRCSCAFTLRGWIAASGT